MLTVLPQIQDARFDLRTGDGEWYIFHDHAKLLILPVAATILSLESAPKERLHRLAVTLSIRR